MKAAFFAALFEAVAVSVTSAYPVTAETGLQCRTGPGTSYSAVKAYPKGYDIKISCQTTGTSINGNNIWDKTQDGCYVADYYVKTGTNGFITTKCGSSGSAVPGPRTDDYPYKSSCGGVDKWNYYKCQCTSFVAWRINDRLGIKFHNQYKGVHWGNANTWDEAAKSSGVTVNKTPKPGAIAQSNSGTYGHVAWVSAVSGDKVTVEEYNWAKREAYGTRTVDKSTFNYIHLK
ncbi:hypothetical protein VTH06DRAFT_983 [Thermothelomyces fergusii]